MSRRGWIWLAAIAQLAACATRPAQIGDAYYANAVRENVLVIALKPGDYKLDALLVRRNPDERLETRYPLEFPFHIAEGQATNLGVVPAVLYLRAAGKPSWQSLPLPGMRCFFLQHDKGGAESLAVFCDSKRFASNDGAHTWAEKTAGKN
jgi:hypothetical protein